MNDKETATEGGVSKGSHVSFLHTRPCVNGGLVDV